MLQLHKKTFEEYLSNKLPNFEEVMDADAVREAKILWDSAQRAYKRANDCLDMQFKSKAGIDYRNDFEKNNDTASEKMAELDDLVSFYAKRELGGQAESKHALK